MVLSFADPAARYSAKEARGRPRMAMTGRRGRSRSGCMLSAQIPPQRGGAEFSGSTSPGRTGARTRSGPRAKRARLSASLVRGWIFGCLPDAAARRKSERFCREETAPGGMDIWQVSF